MAANYIETEKEIIKARIAHAASLPKLPVGPLSKAMPKALRMIEQDTFYLDDLHKCGSLMKGLLEFLVIQNPTNNKYVIPDKAERKTIHNALVCLSKSGCYKMIERYNDVIQRIMKMNLFWKRDIQEWKWSSHNTYKQIKSLIQHLFCQYEVPEFMFQAWLDPMNNYHHIEWFLQISDGGSARDLFKFPLKATRKLAHNFINTPFPGYTINDAVRRAQILALGGDERLADAVLMSRLRHNFSSNDFWETVFKFFIDTPMMNMDEVGTIIDYINQMKFVHQTQIINGVRVSRPLMPGFTMKGRNVEGLITATHNWHKELGKKNNIDLSQQWPQSLIKPFKHVEGNPERSLRVYEIFEILCAKDLHEEGKYMHHCVFSYLRSCINGSCYIFSLRLNDDRLATIEIRGNRIVQVRGPYNKRPSDKEVTLICNWAREEGLDVTNYAFG